jgi:hypothetical protein
MKQDHTRIDEILDIHLTERKSKFDYQLYHDSYTSAVNTGLKHAEIKGYTYDDDEVAVLVGMQSRKPGRGKTTTVHIPLYKNEKPQKKALHIVVYNKETNTNTYELTAYIL